MCVCVFLFRVIVSYRTICGLGTAAHTHTHTHTHTHARRIEALAGEKYNLKSNIVKFCPLRTTDAALTPRSAVRILVWYDDGDVLYTGIRGSKFI
jgi:hypothetical protein